MLDNLTKTAEKNGLKPFEVVKQIAMDITPFSESGLLTTTFKLKRHDARDHYKKLIESTYQGLE